MEAEDQDENKAAEDQSPKPAKKRVSQSQDVQIEPCADFFAVVGPGDTLDVDEKSDLHDPRKMHELWLSAIVDIKILYQDKFPEDFALPVGYEVIRQTPNGAPANLDTSSKYWSTSRETLVCFKRRSSLPHAERNISKYISDIKVVFASDKPAAGYEIVRTIDERGGEGEPGDVNRRGTFESGISTFLAVKINDNEHSNIYHSEPSVQELAIIFPTHGDMIPFGHVLVDANLNRGVGTKSAVYMTIKRGPKIGLCDLPLDAKTVDRYPKTDTKVKRSAESKAEDLHLPSMLPMFCFPHGIHLESCRKFSQPLPKAFNFVFTESTGRRVHVACLIMYQEVSQDALSSLRRQYEKSSMSWSSTGSFSDEDGMEPPDSPGVAGAAEGNREIIVAPTASCLLSHSPIYRGMKRFLKQIYQMSQSNMPLPIERFIAAFVSHTPMTWPGGPTLHLHLDLGIHSTRNSALEPIQISRPDPKAPPMLDLDFDMPFWSLSTGDVIAVISLMLVEKSILFKSSSSTRLNETIEVLMALLFPFCWAHAYIPRLPDRMIMVLDMPSPFIAGLAVDNEEETEFLLETLTFTDGQVFIVDLDASTIEPRSGVEQVLKGLPSDPYKEFQRLLSTQLCMFSNARPGNTSVEFDSAFDLPALQSGSLSSDMAAQQTADRFVDHLLRQETVDPASVIIQNATMIFLSEILGDYQPFINRDACRDATLVQDMFNREEYFDFEKFLAQVPKGSRVFMDAFVHTQMFQYFIQSRIEESKEDFRLQFFDEFREKVGLMREKIAATEGRGSTFRRSSVQDIRDRDAFIPGHFLEGRVRFKGRENTSLQKKEINPDEESHRYIVIGGPTRAGLPDDQTFSYPDGWPAQLDQDKLILTDDHIHQSLVDHKVQAALHITRLDRLRLVHTTKSQTFRSLEIEQEDEKRAVRSMMLFVASYLLCLPHRVSAPPETAPASVLQEILRALGLLLHLEALGLLEFVDEVTWRSIIIACGKCGGVMRYVANALFGMMEKQRIKPNVVTQGQYTEALQSVDCLTEGVIKSWSPVSFAADEDDDLEHDESNHIAGDWLEISGMFWCKRHNAAQVLTRLQLRPDLTNLGIPGLTQLVIPPGRSIFARGVLVHARIAKMIGEDPSVLASSPSTWPSFSATPPASSEQTSSSASLSAEEPPEIPSEPLCLDQTTDPEPEKAAATDQPTVADAKEEFVLPPPPDMERFTTAQAEVEAKADEESPTIGHEQPSIPSPPPEEAELLMPTSGSAEASDNASEPTSKAKMRPQFVVRMWSATPCPKCHETLLDEVMLYRLPLHANSFDDLSIMCNCRSPFVPYLKAKVEHKSGEEELMEVPYLSPVVVHAKLNEVSFSRFKYLKALF